MNTTTLFAETTLDKGTSIHVLDGGEIEIVGRAGFAWITEDHDVRDHVLEPGGRFVARPDRHCIVHALSDVRIRWRSPDPLREEVPAGDRRPATAARGWPLVGLAHA